MFGEFVKSKGFIDQKKLQAALNTLKFRKQKIGRLLVELNYIDQRTLDSLLLQYLKSDSKLTFTQLKSMKEQVSIKRQEQVKPYAVVAIEDIESQLTVVSDCFSDTVIAELEQVFSKEIELLRIKPSIFKLLQGKEEKESKASNIVLSGELSCDQKLSEDNPYTKIAKLCLEEACKSKASDIHFEPFAEKYLIRFRIHGVLQDWKVISSEHVEPITNKLKWILGLDLAVVSKPQDSRASFETLGVDVRVNSMPTASEKEKIVLRIQYKEQKLSLEDIGLDAGKIAVLRRSINKREGLIIISGPTGSGKTTTLYALLEEMDRLGKNISTLENPVEKSLERIVQSNVSTPEDFYEFQKALMRQDPDVILLGEIRDPETADLSMKLASTGHLVLSTVHANGAKEVIDRLLNLGVDSFTVKTNLRLSVAQRLVRKICATCRVPVGDGLYEQNPKGCADCTKGITGRIAIIEYLEKEDIENESTPTTLKDECIQLARKGVIDQREIEAIA